MTEKTQRTAWMKAFFPPTPKDADVYSALFELGRTTLLQAATAQRAALAFYRQFAEQEGQERSSREHQEELLRKMQEAMDPFFDIEQSVRHQVLKVQASLFELCEDTLRGFARHGEEQSRSKAD